MERGIKFSRYELTEIKRDIKINVRYFMTFPSDFSSQLSIARFNADTLGCKHLLYSIRESKVYRLTLTKQNEIYLLQQLPAKNITSFFTSQSLDFNTRWKIIQFGTVAG